MITPAARRHLSSLALIGLAAATAACERLPGSGGEHGEVKVLSFEEAFPALHEPIFERPTRRRDRSRQEAPGLDLMEIARQAAAQSGLRPNLVLALIQQESGFNPRAVSRVGAVGLMQVIPEAAGREVLRRRFGLDVAPSQRMLMDPRINLAVGAAYLADLIGRYARLTGGRPAAETLALAAYNWGPGHVNALLHRLGAPRTQAEAIAIIEGHAPGETRRYIRNIAALERRFEMYGRILDGEETV